MDSTHQSSKKDLKICELVIQARRRRKESFESLQNVKQNLQPSRSLLQNSVEHENSPVDQALRETGAPMTGATRTCRHSNCYFNIFRFWSLRWFHSLSLSGSILQCTSLIPQSPAPAPESSCPCPPDVLSRVYSIQKHHLIVFVALLFLILSCSPEVDSLSLPTRHYCECVLRTLVRAHRTFALKTASHFVNPAQFSLVRCSSVFASLLLLCSFGCWRNKLGKFQWRRRKK